MTGRRINKESKAKQRKEGNEGAKHEGLHKQEQGGEMRTAKRADGWCRAFGNADANE